MKKFFCALLISGVIACNADAQSIQQFKQGDRVVFTGNSITDGGHYHSYIWLYYITHFPNRRMEVFNAGIGGDIARQMYERLDGDVFAKKPTVMTLTFGMNDTGYQNLKDPQADSVYSVKVAEALKSFGLITGKLKQHPEVKKIMIGSSPYDETSKIKTTPLIGKNAAMLRIVAEQKSTAIKNGWGFIDLNTPMTAINQNQQQRDSTFTMEGNDRIHPTNDGQMVMAYLFLKAQGLAGKKVSEVALAVNSKEPVTADNCKISLLSITKNAVKFNYLANSLPYPTDTIPGGFGKPAKSQGDALKLIPFTADFNQELLSVKGLNEGRYILKIDGKVIGSWSADEYAAGINMAVLKNTPQYQQALAIMHINEERWEIERRLREYYWIHYSILKPQGLLFNDGDATVDSLQKYARKDFFVAVTVPTYQKARFKSVRDAWAKEIALLTNQLYAINKPVAHRIEITQSK
jgi:lysophospholipase L1-like esterase